MPYLYKQLQNGEIQKIVQTLHDKNTVRVNSGLPRLIGNQELYAYSGKQNPRYCLLLAPSSHLLTLSK